jgi:hypothetical protein
MDSIAILKATGFSGNDGWIYIAIDYHRFDRRHFGLVLAMFFLAL